VHDVLFLFRTDEIEVLQQLRKKGLVRLTETYRLHTPENLEMTDDRVGDVKRLYVPTRKALENYSW
jgi:hypothetical protein